MEISQLSQKAPYMMYILVNNDLKMGKGKIASQVGHAVGLIIEDIIRNALETPTPDGLSDYQMFLKWKNNCSYKKIVLKASENDLLHFIDTEKKCRYVLDAGRTQIAPGSLTVVGFYPRNDMADKLKTFSLL